MRKTSRASSADDLAVGSAVQSSAKHLKVNSDEVQEEDKDREALVKLMKMNIYSQIHHQLLRGSPRTEQLGKISAYKDQCEQLLEDSSPTPELHWRHSNNIKPTFPGRSTSRVKSVSTSLASSQPKASFFNKAFRGTAYF